MNMLFNIEQTQDLKHWVVQVRDENSEWTDITEDFDTFEEAEEWAEKIRKNHVMLRDIPF